MRPEAHAPRHRRLQRSPHITKASAIDPLDLWRVLGHAGALSTRALRSLTPAAVDAVRARVRCGGTFAVAAFAVAAFAAFAVAALCLSLQCAPPVVTACQSLPPKSMLRRRAPQTTASRVPDRCRSAGMPHAPCGAEPHARALALRFGGNGAKWQHGAEWLENQSRVYFLPLADPVLMLPI